MHSPKSKGVVKGLLVAAGTLSVAIGSLGILLPVLPTTPFLLIAAYCYSRSSERFYRWLLTNRWFGEYIRNYLEGRGIPRSQKIMTVAALWLALGYTILFVSIAGWIKPVLFCIGAGVTFHLLKIKDLTQTKPDP